MHRIPDSHLDAKARAAFSGDDPKVSIDPRLVKWFSTWSGSVSTLLLGPSGCGKTLTAAFAASTVYQFAIREPGKLARLVVSRARPHGGFVRNVQTARWVRADHLSRILSDKNTADEMKAFISAPLLVIDEVGFERFSETFLELIGTRAELGRPMVVTSGLTYDAMVKRYSDSTVRRLANHGGSLLVDCHGPAPKVKIAPRWPVLAHVTRSGCVVGTSEPNDPLAPHVANPGAANLIREFTRGF